MPVAVVCRPGSGPHAALLQGSWTLLNPMRRVPSGNADVTQLTLLWSIDLQCRRWLFLRGFRLLTSRKTAAQICAYYLLKGARSILV